MTEAGALFMFPTAVQRANPVRVFVADSSRIHTELLADALGHDPQLNVVKWDSDCRTLVKTLLSSDVDVLIIGVTIDGRQSDGLEIVRQLQTLRSEIRAIVLLDSYKSESILDAFRAGAKGVFSRDGCPEMLGKCVHCASQGQIWANNHEMAVALEALSAVPRIQSVDAKGFKVLSNRELEVVNSLAQGLTNREIAERMQLSQHTIKNYLFKIFDKLGVSSRVELLFMTLSQTGPRESAADGTSLELTDGRILDEKLSS
jgi:DNA-binding NarL/FixJ family response regulator